MMWLSELQSCCSAPAAIIAAVFLLIAYRWYRSRSVSKNYPPLTPMSMWETIKVMAGDDAPWFFIEMGKKLGTPIFRLNVPMPGTPMMAVVGDHKLAREILTDKTTWKPRQLYQGFDASSGAQNLFSSNGAFWHARRKGVAPAFSSAHVKRMNSIAVSKTDEWIRDRLRPLIEEGKSFDIGDEMIDLLLCAITQTAFEYKISPQEVAMFKKEFELATREFTMKTQLNPLRKVFGFLIPERRRAFVAGNRLDAFALKIVKSYRSLENPQRGTIIDLICSNPCYKDDMERSADVQVLLIGGHDTTAYTLAWTMKELAKNQDLQRELRASVHGAPEGTEPNQLESVHRTIREGIRLHPVSGLGSARKIGRDFVTKSGQVIPKGSICLLPIIMMTRNPAIFGDDVNEFKPSRWETATPEMNLAYQPFSAGRQNCVGQPLANAELHCILPRILSQFELTLEEEGRTQTFLTIKPAKCMLRATPVAQA